MQKGFSVLQILLIAVVIGVIGFAGWYVYDSQKKADSSFNQTNNQQVTNPISKPSEAEKTKYIEAKDYTKAACLKPPLEKDMLQCSLTELGVEFNYPVAWNIEGVVKVAKTTEYETGWGIAGGAYKFDSKSKQWTDLNTKKQVTEVNKNTSNAEFTVYDFGGGDAGCNFGRLIFEAKESLVIVNVPIACEDGIVSQDTSTTKYTLSQKEKDIKVFINSIKSF